MKYATRFFFLSLFTIAALSCKPEPPSDTPCTSYGFADGVQCAGFMDDSCMDGHMISEAIAKVSVARIKSLSERALALDRDTREIYGRMQLAKIMAVRDQVQNPTPWPLHRILRRLKKYGVRGDVEYNLRIVRHQKSTDMGAYTTAGGDILLSEQLVSLLQSEGEAAYLIAREISKLENMYHDRLIVRQISSEKEGQLTHIIRTSVDAMLSGTNHYEELVADRGAVALVSQSGYDPRAALDFFQRLEQYEGRGSENKKILSASIFGSHPNIRTRYNCIAEYIHASQRRHPRCIHGKGDPFCTARRP